VGGAAGEGDASPREETPVVARQGSDDGWSYQPGGRRWTSCGPVRSSARSPGRRRDRAGGRDSRRERLV